MISITKATEKDCKAIVHIGYIAVEEAHRDSCREEDMITFLETNYNDIAITEELNDAKNVYHIINYNGEPAGFSKIILNTEHVNIAAKNVTKLDRIYLLKEFYDLKLGYELMKFNIDFSKKYNQAGIWLFTWVGNTRAVNFYHKAGFKVIGDHKFKVTETHYNENHHMYLDNGND